MASLRKKPSGRWEVRWLDPTGRLRGKSFDRKVDARAFAEQVETEKRQGIYCDPALAKTRFGDFAERWLRSVVHLRPATQESYRLLLRRHVLPSFARSPMGTIDRQSIQEWLSYLVSQGVAPGTIRNAFRVLSRVLREAERSGVLPRTPAVGIRLPRSEREEMRFLSPLEIRRLADAIDPRYRALVLLAGFSGLRFGELAALRIGRLDLLRGSVDVAESVSDVSGRIYFLPTKSGHRRVVPIPKAVCDVLAGHLAAMASNSDLVFPSPNGEVLRQRNFYRRTFKPAVQRAGLDSGLRFHDLRHSAASIAIALGANVKQVQGMLGHASATTTLDTYSHVFPGLAEQLRAQLNTAYEGAEESAELVSIWSAAKASANRSERLTGDSGR